MRPVPNSLHDEVASRLREQIFAGTLPPGSFLDEAALCERLEISRTPLREALKVLAAEGLVTMKLRRGAYVTEVSERDLADVYHLLALLESDAVAVVAERASPDQVAALQALHTELEAAARPGQVNRERFFAINERFHMQVLAIADNRWRDQVVADLRKVMKLHRHNSLLKQGRIDESLAEHRAVMAAIAARDPQAARAQMQAHFDNGLEAAT